MPISSSLALYDKFLRNSWPVSISQLVVSYKRECSHLGNFTPKPALFWYIEGIKESNGLSLVLFYPAPQSGREFDSKNAEEASPSASTGPFLWFEALELVPNTSMPWSLQTQVHELWGLQLYIKWLHISTRTSVTQ